jgi:hypothetical protein
MKLTTQKLKKLIKEELKAVIRESRLKGMSDEELKQQYDIYAYDDDPRSAGMVLDIKDEFEARGMLAPDERMEPGRPEATRKGKMNLATAQKQLQSLYKQQDMMPDVERGLMYDKQLQAGIEELEAYIANLKSGKTLQENAELYYSDLKQQFPHLSEEEINKIIQVMLKQGKKK